MDNSIRVSSYILYFKVFQRFSGYGAFEPSYVTVSSGFCEVGYSGLFRCVSWVQFPGIVTGIAGVRIRGCGGGGVGGSVVRYGRIVCRE